MSFNIGKRQIGDGHPCFITFEAGPTHSGLESAVELARLAAKAGADAIKFQIMDPERLVADKQQLFEYSILVDRKTGQTKDVSESLYEILKRRSLKEAEWRKLKAECDAVGLAFFATAFFPEEIKLLGEMGCHSIKIASGDVNHIPLIRQAAATGTCIQLDTGNSTIGEVEESVDAVFAAGNRNVIIHHCPSGYPARLEGINLRIIPTLKTMFDLPVAFSDHSPGWEMDVAAVALGANLIEKTITFDRTTPSVEHIFSLEPADMQAFIKTMSELDTALGTKRRLMSPPERAKRDKVRRSCFFKQDVKAGVTLTEDLVDYRRPGSGIPPNLVDSLLGRKVVRDGKGGEMIKPGDVG